MNSKIIRIKIKNVGHIFLIYSVPMIIYLKLPIKFINHAKLHSIYCFLTTSIKNASKDLYRLKNRKFFWNDLLLRI